MITVLACTINYYEIDNDLIDSPITHTPNLRSKDGGVLIISH